MIAILKVYLQHDLKSEIIPSPQETLGTGVLWGKDLSASDKILYTVTHLQFPRFFGESHDS